MALSNKWPEPMELYNSMDQSLGNIGIVKVADDLYVCNMVAQNGINSYGSEFKRRVDYDALKKCLDKVNKYASDHDMEVHMPKIGAGLAGGDWDIIEGIIESSLDDINVVVYELAD